MGARGIYTAQDEHVVNILPPINASGGKTAQAFTLARHAHASIILQVGASNGNSGTLAGVVVNACTDAAGTSPTAIGFDLFKCETGYTATNGDVLSAKTAVTAAGFVPATTDNEFYVIELDAAAVESAAAGKPYIQLVLTDNSPATTNFLASAVAILSAARYGEDQSDTVIA